MSHEQGIHKAGQGLFKINGRAAVVVPDNVLIEKGGCDGEIGGDGASGSGRW